MYYLQKKGVYLHGTFWIGESLEAGIEQANLHANNDSDGYHEWELCEYKYGEDDDRNQPVYSTNKDEIINDI